MKRPSKAAELARADPRDRLELILVAVGSVPEWVWMLTPFLAFADVPVPASVRLAGLAVTVAGIGLLWWSHALSGRQLDAVRGTPAHGRTRDRRTLPLGPPPHVLLVLPVQPRDVAAHGELARRACPRCSRSPGCTWTGSAAKRRSCPGRSASSIATTRSGPAGSSPASGAAYGPWAPSERPPALGSRESPAGGGCPGVWAHVVCFPYACSGARAHPGEGERHMADENRIGTKITTLRESLGLSQEELAERADCDVVVIEQLEDGELAPSLAPLIKITRALGCRLGTLLDDETEIGPGRHAQGRGRGRHALQGRLHRRRAAASTSTRSPARKASKHMEPFIIDDRAAGRRRAARSPVARGRGVHLRPRRLARGRVRQGHDHAAAGRQHLLRLDRARTRCAPPADAPARILAVVYAPV